MAEPLQLIHADRLSVLTGLTDQRHRQLAKEGYFPNPEGGDYQLVATIQGLFRYYREAAQRSRKHLDDLKAGKLERENRKLDLEIARGERKLVPVADVDKMLLHISSLQKVVLYQKLEREMPVRTEGKDVPSKQLLGRGIADELCEIFSQESDKWQALLEEPEPAAALVAAAAAS